MFPVTYPVNFKLPYTSPSSFSCATGYVLVKVPSDNVNYISTMSAISWQIPSLHSAILPNKNGSINTLRPRQNGRNFTDDIFKCIFLNENAWISLKISLKFVPKVRINNIPALVHIMAWRRPGDKPLSEPMMVSLLTHICVTRPQWVNML